MIPKAQVLELAGEQQLLPTTVEKDYVLGWLLYGFAQNEQLSRWVFKGGTCLKKCFFDTYRFSEDLDFTIPESEPLTSEAVRRGLHEVTTWVANEAGIEFPADRLDVELYDNKRGRPTIQARLTYVGPLQMPKRTLQRVKLDLTQDELIVDTPARRPVFHPYRDALHPPPQVTCYSVNEVVAEKARALYERQGRARDVYDLVHLSRVFRDEIDVEVAAEVARKKFAFKDLPEPTAEGIIERIDADVLRDNWEHQLGHQLPLLPVVETFLAELKEALAWWLEPQAFRVELPPVPAKPTEHPVPRQWFPPRRGMAPEAGMRAAAGMGGGGSMGPWPAMYGGGPLDRIRFAARNHLCVELTYKGVPRLVEPYSLRRPMTGNILLYAHERSRGGVATDQIKAFNVGQIMGATPTTTPFAPRYLVEL